MPGSSPSVLCALYGEQKRCSGRVHIEKTDTSVSDLFLTYFCHAEANVLST